MLYLAINYLSVYLNSLKSEKGQGMAEYGLIIALIAVVVVGSLVLLGEGIGTSFENLLEALDWAGDDG